MSGGRDYEDDPDEMVMQVLALIRRQERERAKQSEEKEKARSRFPDFEKIRERAARALAPLKPADKQSIAPKDLPFVAKSTKAGRHLPEPYLVYFLLVDLLNYRDLGHWEKLAYSIPVDFNGTAYLVEHRKFGLGLFAADPELQEDDATRIVHLIRNAVKVSRPYFEHLADEAADGSKLNLKNHSRALYDRYLFFRTPLPLRSATPAISAASALPGCRRWPCDGESRPRGAGDPGTRRLKSRRNAA